jgi:microsomal dipeptidase-like Zn-dependent dipeptidase
MSSKCSYRKRSQRGGAAKEVTGFNSIPYAAVALSGSNSQAAMMAKIPQSIAEQGMNFQKMTSTYHRTRKGRKGRKQYGGAAPVENTGAVLPSSMTGPMTTVASGVLGGSATGRLDTMLSQTASLVKQVGGGSRKRKQQQKQQQRKQQKTRKQKQQRKQQQKQQKSRKQQRKQKQRGGSHQPLGFGPAAPTSGDYTLLSPQELKAAGLNPQWFDENQVNPGFGGAITVPGGKLN